MTNKDKKKKIFFSGIGGSGLSAIASFMSEKDIYVIGSDRSFDRNPDHSLKQILEAGGIKIVPQDGNGIDETCDLVVFSTAVEKDRPEMIRSTDLGIPVKTRPEYLTAITNSYRTVAVAGTSGKSTTSGMLAFLMNELNLKTNFIGGGRVKQFKTETNPGNTCTAQSDYLVIEACESDGSIVNYRPMHSILLNLSFDHNPINETAGMFRTFMGNTSGKKIVNGDDKNLTGIELGQIVTFSIDSPSDFRAEEVSYRDFSTSFSVRGTKFILSLPGRHNLYNALSCIALLSEMGVSAGAISEVLPKFSGIERRFDIHLNDGSYLVIDDYAHNPHKISSLMSTMRRIKESVCYIFQPHGFGPTRQMKKEYIATFLEELRSTDHLILLPIFFAGGTASRDISSKDLADGIKAGGRSVEVIEDRNSILERVDEWDSYAVFGARDDTLADLAKLIAKRLK